MPAVLRRRTARARRTTSAALLAAVLAALVLPATSLAHAKVVSSTPADGAILAQPPSTVTIAFDEALGLESHFEVLDAAGVTVGSGKPDPPDATTMVGPVTAPTGIFAIQWTAVSSDGDIERGVIRFTVAPATAPPIATPEPSVAPSVGATASVGPSAVPSAAPTVAPSPMPGADTADDGSAVLLPIVIVLALAAGGFLVLRRRASAT